MLLDFSGGFLDLEVKVAGLEDGIVASLQAHRLTGGCIVSSFLPEVLLRLRELAPELPLGLIAQTRKRLALWPSLPIQAVFVYHSLLSRELMSELRAENKQVFVWTVNDRREMLRFAELEVDGIISDDTRLLAETFAESGISH